jgi:hypothetical protein
MIDPRPRLTLLTREQCELCERMHEELAALAVRVRLPALELKDVDSDPQLAQRFGLKIPVLLLDGTPVCAARLDAPELLRLLRL